MKQPTLLLVDDESAILEPLARYLETEGFGVVKAANSAEAEACMAAAAVDLVVLDWALPDIQGTDLLRRWRGRGLAVPVIMLTARHELIDKVVGLELGADDYLTKPFEPRELLARIRARLRQAAGRAAPTDAPAAPAPGQTRTLKHAGIEMNPESRRVLWRGAGVDLTRMEFDLLRLLLENAGKVFTRDELLDKVWGYESYPTTRTVDTHILQLRQKFDPSLFETVRGVGYRLGDGRSGQGET